MKRKYLFLLFLICSIFVACNKNKANPASDFYYYYTTETTDSGYTFEGIIIKEYKGISKNVIIPNELDKAPVVIIDMDAFSNKELTSVIIPDTVEYIMIGAFRNNNLTSIIIPNSVKVIETGAFEVNQISDLTIGNSVEIIGMRAFESNQITSITIPNSVKKIHGRAFFDNQIDEIIIDSPIDYIGFQAFSNNYPTSITLGENIDYIDMSAFYVSLYYDYLINENKKATYTISLETFSDFEIAVINNSFIEIINYIGINKNVTIPAEINSLPVLSIGTGAFSDHDVDFYDMGYFFTVQFGGRDSNVFDKEITNISIPNSILTIGSYAFYSNQLENIIIPNSVDFIGNIAFAGNNIGNAIIGNSVRLIGEGAFSGNKLSNITIPNSVQVIRRGAFSGNPLKTFAVSALLDINASDEYDSIFGSINNTPNIIRY